MRPLVFALLAPLALVLPGSGSALCEGITSPCDRWATPWTDARDSPTADDTRLLDAVVAGERLVVNARVRESPYTVGVVAAYELAAGLPLWSTEIAPVAACDCPLDGERPRFLDWVSPITASGDGSRIYTVRNFFGNTSSGFNALFLHALDASDGTILWETQYRAADCGCWGTHFQPLLGDIAHSDATGLVYVTGSNLQPNVLAFDAATGAPAWTASFPTLGSGRPFSGSFDLSDDGATLFAAGHQGVAAFNSTTGATIWTWRPTGPPGAVVSDLVDEIVYHERKVLAAGRCYNLCPGPERLAFRVHDAATGALLGRAQGPEGYALSLVVSGNVAVASGITALAGFDATTGALLWASPLAEDDTTTSATFVSPTRIVAGVNRHAMDYPRGPGETEGGYAVMEAATGVLLDWSTRGLDSTVRAATTRDGLAYGLSHVSGVGFSGVGRWWVEAIEAEPGTVGLGGPHR